jgi:2-phosphoglycerate kinase
VAVSAINSDIRVILIGGTSHTGKSTLAGHLAQQPGWTHVSTDSLARHPGRPWGATGARPHVARHYLELSDGELLRSVLTHYRNMWPLTERLVRKHATDRTAPRLVLEGSGLLPENLVFLSIPGTAFIWLTGDAALFRSRIYKESAYDKQSEQQRKMIDAFVTRTANFDRAMMVSIREFNLPFVEVPEHIGIDELARECVDKIGVLA